MFIYYTPQQKLLAVIRQLVIKIGVVSIPEYVVLNYGVPSINRFPGSV